MLAKWKCWCRSSRPPLSCLTNLHQPPYLTAGRAECAKAPTANAGASCAQCRGFVLLVAKRMLTSILANRNVCPTSTPSPPLPPSSSSSFLKLAFHSRPTHHPAHPPPLRRHRSACRQLVAAPTPIPRRLAARLRRPLFNAAALAGRTTSSSTSSSLRRTPSPPPLHLHNRLP